LDNNALANLKRLSLSDCGIGDDGIIALASVLEQNISLLHLDLRDNHELSERFFLLWRKVYQRSKCYNELTSLGVQVLSLRCLNCWKDYASLFRFHVAGCAPSSVPPAPTETAKCAGDWKQETERVGYRNRFLPMIRAREESLPPLGVWPHALARVATLPDVIFEVLRSNPSLLPSTDT
jgi:hypothetical protein